MNGEHSRADVPRDVPGRDVTAPHVPGPHVPGPDFTAPDGTALDVTALAELDAGLPTDAEAAHRRAAAAAADPDTAAVLEALAATRAELAALPAPELPEAVAARWTAALAAEADERSSGRHTEPWARRNTPSSRDMETYGPSSRPTETIRPGSPGRQGGREAPRRLMVAAAVVAAVAAGLGALLLRPEPPAPAVDRVELVALGRAAVGTMDVGTLADPQRRGACLDAVAPGAAREVLLGGRRVVLDGQPGVLLVLATGTTGRLQIVTVDPDCGPAGGTLLAQLVVG